MYLADAESLHYLQPLFDGRLDMTHFRGTIGLKGDILQLYILTDQLSRNTHPAYISGFYLRTPPMSWTTYIAPSCSKEYLLLNSHSLDSVNNADGIQVVSNCDLRARIHTFNTFVCHTSTSLTTYYKDTIKALDHTTSFHALDLSLQRQKIACDLLHVSGLSLQLPRRRTDPSPCQVLVTQ